MKLPIDQMDTKQLPQCSATTKTQKQCKNHVSREGETKCSRHGGLKKDGNTVSQGFVCGHITHDNVACKHRVHKEGELCAQHSETKKTCQKCKRIVKQGKEFCAAHDPTARQFVSFHELTVDFLKVFVIAKDNTILRDLASWYLDLAEHANKGTPTDAFMVQWYVRGQSNASGDSFGEKHKSDPLKVLFTFPGMEKYKSGFESKFNALVADPQHAVMKDFWNTYLQNSNL